MYLLEACARDEPHDSGECGLLPDRRHSHAQAAATGNCSRNDSGTCLLRHHFGLAGNHGLVNVSSALDNSAICRSPGSGSDENDIVGP